MKEERFRRNNRTGKHLFRYDGKMQCLGPGDTITCDPEALGSQIKNYTCLSSREFKVEEQKKEKPKGPYIVPIIIQRKGTGYCDIFNPLNMEKPLNSKGLRKEEAESILKPYIDLAKEGEAISIDDISADIENKQKRIPKEES